MEFRESQPIFLQIAEYVCEKILLGEWKPEEKIPSVRELAVTLEVNPNTVMRTYEQLKQTDIIYDKRGIGCFVTARAEKIILEQKRKEFTEKELPALYRNMYLLGLTPDDLTKGFEKFKKQNFK